MRILHVEDNAPDAQLVAALLQREWRGVEIEVVANAQQLAAALASRPADLVLADYALPGFSGEEALATVRAHDPDLPVIIVSGVIGDEAAVQIVRAGAFDYLLKDRLQRLPHAVRQALRDRDQRRAQRAATERIRAQAELLDRVFDAVIAGDAEYRVTSWNRAAERIFGYGAPEAVGRPLWERVGDACAATLQSLVLQAGATGEWRGEMALADVENRQIQADVRVTIERDPLGRMQSWLAVLTEVTEKRELQVQLLRTQRLESLGMLAAGIAHDLNNALAPMLMAGGLLRSRVTDPADLRLVELLEQSAQRGAALVKQIVSFAGARGRERVIVQPKHLCREILQLVQETFPKAIRVDAEIPAGLWPLAGDPTQLHQVLLNLCINARDAMPKGGVLRLRAANALIDESAARGLHGGAPGRYVVLEVADTGVGIPAAVLAHIWEPFFTTKPEGQGTGLGLSTVRGIVAAHGGFIDLVSEPGRETRFRVYLPVATDQELAPAATGGERQLPPGRGELILVVDDQVSVGESIAAVLVKHRYRPLLTHDSIEALSKYGDRIRDVALLITDVDMPGLDGLALAQGARALNPSLRILFVSGTGEVGRSGDVAAVTGAEILGKPFSPETLVRRVAALLSGQSGDAPRT